MYNAKTGNYDSSIKPNTKNEYNTFGELVKTSCQINESECAQTYYYYDKEGNKIGCIDAEGYVTAYTYNSNNDLETITEFINKSAQWDLNQYESPQTSYKDRTVVFQYNELGLVVSKTLKQQTYQMLNALGNGFETKTADLTTYYGWDALGLNTSITDVKGNTAYFYYDALGQLRTKIGPQTQAGRAATTYTYDALGSLVQTRCFANGALSADSEHFVLNKESARDLVTEQTFDNLGQLIALSNALNERIDYSYDENGYQVRSFRLIKQSNNLTLIQDKRCTYDSEGHLIQTKTFKNSSQFKSDDARYDVFGDLTDKGVNGAFNTHMEYDNQGRVWRSNSQGYYQIYVYDLMGNLTQVVSSTNAFSDNYGKKGLDLSDPAFEHYLRFDLDRMRYNLQRQNNAYDKLGHLLSQIKESTASPNIDNPEARLQITRQDQENDRWGNMLKCTNALGYTTEYEYNGQNQLIKQLLPQVTMVDHHGVSHTIKPVNYYAYDDLGLEIGIIDANGHINTKKYDAMGQLVSETDAKGNERFKQYNLLNQLTAATNELGAVTRYFYDQANRLIQIDTPGTNQVYSYNEEGQLIKQVASGQATTTYEYDSLGNQVVRTSAQGIRTEFQYDDFGRKTGQKDALGKSQSWRYDDNGRLIEHVNLGGHTTRYEYNTNGLLLTQKSSAGQDIRYQYTGDGQILEYVDAHGGSEEVVDFSYDALGQVQSKVSSRGGNYKDGWLRENDRYQYDALGRLVGVQRKNLESPDLDLLDIAYEYDAVGNIRHTKTQVHYAKYISTTDEYFTYDENNRMRINKGELIGNEIGISAKQGSILDYDLLGNISDAYKYEASVLNHYQYHYDRDNRLDLVRKNDHNLQSRQYDALGQMVEQRSFDLRGGLVEKDLFDYVDGVLVAQKMKNAFDQEVSHTNYYYDAVGNLTFMSTRINPNYQAAGYTTTHAYSYDLWDEYQQSLDTATLMVDNQTPTTGKSQRIYDANGQLLDAVDEVADETGKTHTTHYWFSSLEGLRTRADADGQTSYLTIAGKTIADVHLDTDGMQHVNVYAGFTPTGTAANFNFVQPVSPDIPQNNLGIYTIQAGDTLESIAQQVYGDANLWYLIADANGLIDKTATAGQSTVFHVGQQINIPPVAASQHHTDKTQKVMNIYDQLGTISATLMAPMVFMPKDKNDSLFAALIVAVVSTVVTVLTAGIAGVIAGAAEASSLGSFASLFATGLRVLAGGAIKSTAGSIAAGFTAGFVGNLSSQATAKALNMQDQIDLKQALLSGATTASASALTKTLYANSNYQALMEKLDQITANKIFKLSSAAEMLEQNASNQALNLTLNKKQNFDWQSLITTTLSAGLFASPTGEKLTETLNQIDHNTNILTNELKTLTQSPTNPIPQLPQTLSNTLGNTLASYLITQQAIQELTPPPQPEYCPIPDALYRQFQEDEGRRRLAMREIENEANTLYGLKPEDVASNPTKDSTTVENKFLWNQSHKLDTRKTSTIAMDLEFDLGIDYGKLYDTKKSAYPESQIVKGSYYHKSPGSPIAGDVNQSTQKQVINKLIAECMANGLGLHDTAYVLAIARKESGFNPYAAAGTTSAFGIGQFLNGTCHDYSINDSNRWDLQMQVSSLVKIYIKNVARYSKLKPQSSAYDEAYIYKLHHDGGRDLNVKGQGLQIARTQVLPMIKGIENVIRKLF